MIYLIIKIDDEDIIIGEITGYSMLSGTAGTENNKDIIREIQFTYEHKKVKEWVDKTESVPFITIFSNDGRNTLSKCTRKINQEGYATYSYEILWPGYNTIHDDFSELIIQFKRNQKIEDILE
jgi:hypothetical protein